MEHKLYGTFHHFVDPFHFFSKYPKHEWPRTFIRKYNYEYMDKPNMKWNESIKTADIKKTILTSLFTEIETERKK